MTINISKQQIAEVCEKNRIRKLSLFGSILREDFKNDSDIDVLVEFEEGNGPGYFGLARMARDISNIFEGRKVDIRTPMELSRYFRNEVLSSAEIQYEKG
tara:strand:- start:224 stop:523 length:300 start_codon:yes stop_codon:yes gene_type:complete